MKVGSTPGTARCNATLPTPDIEAGKEVANGKLYEKRMPPEGVNPISE